MFADKATYTPADQILVLNGSPRVIDGGMTTTADVIRLNRQSGEAFADNVKTTYSDLKPQPGGALLATSEPVHVTARNMVSHKQPGIANYTGNVRLWQTGNVVRAPKIDFDQQNRSHHRARRYRTVGLEPVCAARTGRQADPRRRHCR